MTTSDISKFGIRELKIAIEFLDALSKQNIDADDNLQLMFNTSSGYVFLTDDYFRVWMLYDGNYVVQKAFLKRLKIIIMITKNVKNGLKILKNKE